MRGFGYEWPHFSDFRPDGDGQLSLVLRRLSTGELARYGKSALVFDSGEGNDIVAPRVVFDYST